MVGLVCMVGLGIRSMVVCNRNHNYSNSHMGNRHSSSHYRSLHSRIHRRCSMALVERSMNKLPVIIKKKKFIRTQFIKRYSNIL